MPFRLPHPGRSLRPDPVALGRLLGPELAERPDHGGLVQGEELRLAGVGAGVVPGRGGDEPVEERGLGLGLDRRVVEQVHLIAVAPQGAEDRRLGPFRAEHLPRLVGRPRVHAHGGAAVSLLPIGHPRHVRPFARMCTVPAVSTPCAGSLSLDSSRCGGIFIRRVSVGACKARRGRVSKLLCMPIPIKRWSMSDPIAAAEAAGKARDIANRFETAVFLIAYDPASNRSVYAPVARRVQGSRRRVPVHRDRAPGVSRRRLLRRDVGMLRGTALCGKRPLGRPSGTQGV